MRPSQTILVLEDLSNSYSGPLHRKGIELSLSDRQTTLEVYQQWLLLLIDLDYLHHDTLKRDVHGLFTDMVRADVLSLNNAFAELLHLVRMQDSRGFKALCTCISQRLYHILKKDVENYMSGDVYAAKRLIQVFSYTSRLTLHDIDLTQECLEDYMATEDRIDPWLPEGLLTSLNTIVSRWMRSFGAGYVDSADALRPQHGPGGVAGHGRTSYEVKYKDLTYDKRLTYAFGEPVWCDSQIRSELDRVSHTIFVPKSYKTFRTISMEPSTLMYFQQGIWKEIDRVVNTSPKLRSHIGFHDQTRNQRLAKTGSIERNYATIDLSAASDSVSYALVKRIFRGTKLLRFIVATRSTKTLLPDGRLVELKKFAPMGSALCFPIETIIFAAICQFVTREHGVTNDYSVFGDDIIVPTQCVEDVILTLETLGFQVNRSKSFYQSDCWFRESCGAEYCDGYNVTPMRVSRSYRSSAQLLQTTSLISLANNAHEYGFRNLRSFFLRKLRLSGFTALFAPTEVLSDNYTNYHTERRWNHHLQRIEAKTTSFQPRFRGICDENIRLRHWFESTRDRISIEDGFQSETRRPTVLPKDGWRMKPFEDLDQSFIDFFTNQSANRRTL